ncbi:serine hydrolase [Neolewinella persica]|uniref:serine hydrolase n=1 Tax=Neolewinella persica TaxID=70998 RepID=UPI000361B80E|nr:serine hydrolase [Neolewinella persica]
MYKRFSFFILSMFAVLFMSTVNYGSQQSFNQQLSASSVFGLPSFLLAEPAAPITKAFNSTREEMRMEIEASVPSLRSLKNLSFEDQLKRRLNTNPLWRSLIRNKRMSVGVVDMSDGDAVKFATVNGQHMMYAASLPKIAVLAAAHDAIERGELKESAAVKADMRLMIAKSNNAATTRMIDRIGFEKIERTMTDPDLKLYDPAYGGGLWVGKRYAAGGRRHPDPMKGISHAATTEQICRYFYLLANNELISEKSSAKMRSYLVDPQLHHKFVNVLDQVAPNAKVYRKSGSWSTFHADVALVQGPDRNYIITALVDDPKGEQICRDLAKVLDSMLVD